jgi:hypothetical protein
VEELRWWWIGRRYTYFRCRKAATITFFACQKWLGKLILNLGSKPGSNLYRHNLDPPRARDTNKLTLHSYLLLPSTTKNMTELSYSKSFLSMLAQRPIRLAPDYVQDPRQLPARNAVSSPPPLAPITANNFVVHSPAHAPREEKAAADCRRQRRHCHQQRLWFPSLSHHYISS